MSREIGISKLTVFELRDPDTPDYGGPESVPWVVNIDISKVVAEYSAFADNVAELSSSKPTSADLTIEVSSDMKPSLEAKLTGVKFSNGLMIQGTDDTKPSWGIAYETVMDTGKVRRYFFTNCTISKDEQSNETISDSVNPVTYSLNVKAIPLPVTKELLFVMDEDDYKKAYDDAQANLPLQQQIEELWTNWFTQAPRPVA